MRVQAVARGRELTNTVAYLSGAVMILEAGENLLNTVVENETTGTTASRLTAERDAAVQALTAAESERTAYLAAR